MKRTILFLALIISVRSLGQLAVQYPNDIGIESDSSVLFVEKFNDGLAAIIGRYNEVLHAEEFTLDTDIPLGSAGPYSLKISNTPGINSGGHLFKAFSPGFDSTVFLRYYVKYPAIEEGYFGHQGVWFGGYNPIIPYPYPRAGVCGLGDSRLSIAFESVWQVIPPGMDTYLYWGDMHSYDGGYTCFGNTMITRGKTNFDQPPSVDEPINDLGEWMCIEIMIKLNNPITAYNGELKVWKNGEELGHWGPGFPNGHWFKDKWYNNPNDPPFEGFRWRTNENLNINWIWIEFYHDTGPASHIKFSNIVMAKEYIGPIYHTNTAVASEKQSMIKVYPNPTKGKIRIACDEQVNSVSVINVFGQILFTKNQSDEIDLTNLQSGIYFLNIETQWEKQRLVVLKTDQAVM
ncbi:MAG: T9SS type A sorting domain-containing protein [Bacteroidales bacterium]|nr:T9SS type A sorting domain-containing protein [Bacteroidales bacterium]